MRTYESHAHSSAAFAQSVRSRSVENRGVIVALATFAAISAFAGGVSLLSTPHGGSLSPLTLLEHSPFTSFLIPGLILTLFVGGTNALCAVMALRNARLAVDATILAGGTLLVWIVVEMALMREVQWLHLVYGSVGAALLALGAVGAWRTGLLRYRWVVAVTIAETLGYFAPACVGVIATSRHLSEPVQALLVVAAGFVEGFLLGAGQALVMPLPIAKLRYALFTSLGAGIVWASVMSMTALFGYGLPPVLMAMLGLVVGVVGLLAIGGMQWLVVRRCAPHARRWIFWTALAWVLALPLSFTPAPFVDQTTPLAPNLVLWSCGGLLMALVMALVTWQGVRTTFLLRESTA